MTAIIDAIGTTEGIAAVILLVLGLLMIVAYAARLRNVYVLVLSLICFASGAILLGVATDVIDIAWNGWTKTPAVEPTPAP